MDISKYYYEDGTPFYGIFKEIVLSGQYMKEPKEPLFTIGEFDTDLPSAHKIYMESMNEYDAAMKLVPTWSFWNGMLRASSKIKNTVHLWREEKIQKDQAETKAMLWEQAKKGNIQAQRFLYEAKKEEQQLRSKEREESLKDIKKKETLNSALDRLTNIRVVK